MTTFVGVCFFVPFLVLSLSYAHQPHSFSFSSSLPILHEVSAMNSLITFFSFLLPGKKQSPSISTEDSGSHSESPTVKESRPRRVLKSIGRGFSLRGRKSRKNGRSYHPYETDARDIRRRKDEESSVIVIQPQGVQETLTATIKEEGHTPSPLPSNDAPSRKQATRSLDKLDLNDETDLVECCKRLNNRIANMALTITDKWVRHHSSATGHSNSSCATPDGAPTEGERFLASMFGYSLLRQIRQNRSSPPSDDLAGLVETAIRASAVQYAGICANDFCYGHPKDKSMKECFDRQLASSACCILHLIKFATLMIYI